MMPSLDGPRREPRGVAPQSLVVLLHGYGASGEDLIGLADAWAPRLAGAAFVAPHAPEELPFAGAGYQWFELTFRDPAELWRGVTAAGPALERYIAGELARYRLPRSRLALVGFSQGSMMALHVGIGMDAPLAGIVAYSGLIAGPEHLPGQVKTRPPVALIHGEADDVIPVEALHQTREALAAEGVPVAWHVRPGLGHGIDEIGLRYGGAFLGSVLR